MEKFKSFMKKYWISVWLILVAMAVITVYVSAEYIQDQNRVKRVIANMGDTGKRFSSDRLNPTDSITPYEVPFSTEGDDLCPIAFQIYNHSLTDSSKKYQGEIYYEITAKLTDHNGETITMYDDNPDTTNIPSLPGSSYGFKKGDAPSYTFFANVNDMLSLDGHFESNEENDNHLYYICIPRTMTTVANDDKVYIELVATPYADSNYTRPLTDIDVLKARLSVSSQSKSVESGWSGSFQDSTRTDLDGLNFVFSGSGTSKLVLSYRADLFEVNKFFLDAHSSEHDSKFTYENGYYYEYETATVNGEEVKTWKKYAAPSGESWKTIIIDADSEDEKRYDIQLYMNNADTENYLTNRELDWNNKISNYFHYNANAPATAVTS
ncbi:hypothetical protein [Ruminococcus flavefaciens]|uniref:hypothetical protein n=1 Tax=Ruminococcus flavefaciens TaxID=1265 RepID=UPI0004900564|nr:hypothetical protein [Ruminococcus flavefaciens]